MPPFNENLNQENLFAAKKPEYQNNDKKLAPEGSGLELIRKTPEGLLYSMLPNTHQVIEEIAKHKEITDVQAVLVYHLTGAMVHSPNFPKDNEEYHPENEYDEGPQTPVNAIRFFDINDISGKSSNQINEASHAVTVDDREHSVVPMKASFDNVKNIFTIETVWRDYIYSSLGCSVFVDSQGKVIIKSGSDSKGFEALVISNEVIPEENGSNDYHGKTRVISSDGHTVRDVLNVTELLRIVADCRQRADVYDEQDRKVADDRIRNLIRDPGSTHQRLDDDFFARLIVGAIDKEDYFKEIIERDSARLLTSKYLIFALSKNNQTVTAEEVKTFFDSNKELVSKRFPISCYSREAENSAYTLVSFTIIQGFDGPLTDFVQDGRDPLSDNGIYNLGNPGVTTLKMEVEEFKN